jgi:2-hydroxychromene-2-carboxylate isomerase
VTAEFLKAIAGAAGVKDIARWNTDRKSPRVRKQAKATTAEAKKLGLTGTPSFAIKGPKSDGLEVLGAPTTTKELVEAIEKVR